MFFYDFFFALHSFARTHTLFKLIHSRTLVFSVFFFLSLTLFLFVCLPSNESCNSMCTLCAKLLEEGLYHSEVKWVTIYFHFIRAFDDHSAFVCVFFFCLSSRCQITFFLCFCPRFRNVRVLISRD